MSVGTRIKKADTTHEIGSNFTGEEHEPSHMRRTHGQWKTRMATPCHATPLQRVERVL